MRLRKAAVVLSALLLMGSLSAFAGIIGNGPPNQSNGSDLNSYLEADNFTTGSDGSFITQVKFWALQSSPADYAGSIDWAFYSDAAGTPGSAVAGGNAAAVGTLTGNSVFGLDEYSYVFDVNTLLASNTAYWLVLHNGPSSTDPGTTFYWAWSADTGNSQNQFLGSSGWVSNESELAFQVTAVPEPASMCLIGSGLVAGWLKRRKIVAKN